MLFTGRREQDDYRLSTGSRTGPGVAGLFENEKSRALAAFSFFIPRFPFFLSPLPASFVRRESGPVTRPAPPRPPTNSIVFDVSDTSRERREKIHGTRNNGALVNGESVAGKRGRDGSVEMDFADASTPRFIGRVGAETGNREATSKGLVGPNFGGRVF